MYTRALTFGSTPTSETIIPENEWPTSTVGPDCAAIARRAASDASCKDVRGFCTLVQLMPFCWRRAMTFDQQEPSANSPCTKTTFLVFGEVWALAIRLNRGRTALAAAAPINVRRFMVPLLLSGRRVDLEIASGVHERYREVGRNEFALLSFRVSGFFPQQLVVTVAAAASDRRIV